MTHSKNNKSNKEAAKSKANKGKKEVVQPKANKGNKEVVKPKPQLIVKGPGVFNTFGALAISDDDSESDKGLTNTTNAQPKVDANKKLNRRQRAKRAELAKLQGGLKVTEKVVLPVGVEVPQISTASGNVVKESGDNVKQPMARFEMKSDGVNPDNVTRLSDAEFDEATRIAIKRSLEKEALFTPSPEAVEKKSKTFKLPGVSSDNSPQGDKNKSNRRQRANHAAAKRESGQDTTSPQKSGWTLVEPKSKSGSPKGKIFKIPEQAKAKAMYVPGIKAPVKAPVVVASSPEIIISDDNFPALAQKPSPKKEEPAFRVLKIVPKGQKVAKPQFAKKTVAPAPKVPAAKAPTVVPAKAPVSTALVPVARPVVVAPEEPKKKSTRKQRSRNAAARGEKLVGAITSLNPALGRVEVQKTAAQYEAARRQAMDERARKSLYTGGWPELALD
ncbi:hypothetical protein EDC01DRAFT_790825 [Geopyxis carbonaria]|nr:hypothetical protein EDC01DRAFT_790825 [Geopyxis carbonaria]